MVKEIHKEIELITSYLNPQEKDKVRHALKLSEEAHSNQLRKSGDPFITHPLEVAKILTSIKLDADSIVAGLLHDTLEDTNLNINEINKNSGNINLVAIGPLTNIANSLQQDPSIVSKVNSLIIMGGSWLALSLIHI